MRKTVLITGASRGIGKSCAILFAKNNYNVVINYLNSYDKAMKLKNELESTYGVDAMIIKADVSSEKDVINMIDKVISRFKSVEVLVNNAGVAMDSMIDDKTKDSFNKVLDTNLVGPFLVIKHLSKYMLQKKYGKIINISSTNGIDTYYSYSLDYDASKAGLISLTHNFAMELAPYINVNCVAPGWVNTDMNKGLDDDYIKNECDKILLGRFAEPSEIANVVYFLASDMANYINNSVIRVDGGIKN